MLRICFSPEDMLRVRVAPTADPLWEILLSMHILQTSNGGPFFDNWRQQVRARIRQERSIYLAGRFLAPLYPVARYVPDFLTPPESGKGLQEGIDAVLSSSPRCRIRSELARMAETSSPPAYAAALAAGDPDILKHLGQALKTYHAAMLEPYWDRIQAHVRIDHAQRAQALLSGGGEQLFASFESMRWRAPVLDVDYPFDRELRLDGRGLVLTPSVFCWRTPIALADDALPPVLIYPINCQLDWASSIGKDPRDSGVAALIGRTRTAVLEYLTDKDRLTGELARLTATTPATISKHTSVLRDAGLITSIHTGRQTVHRITPLGTTLLNKKNMSRSAVLPGPPNRESLSPDRNSRLFKMSSVILGCNVRHSS